MSQIDHHQRAIINTFLKTLWDTPAIKNVSLQQSGKGTMSGETEFWHGANAKLAKIEFKITYAIGDNDDDIAIVSSSYKEI